MPAGTKQTHKFKNLWIGGRKISAGLPLVPNAAQGVKVRRGSRLVQADTFDLTSFAITVAAASDFDSKKLCDLPNTGAIILGAVIELTATVSGFTSDVGTAVDLALGTVATASTNFANAGEDNIVAKIDGTGAGATATVKGQTADAEKLVFVAAGGSNAIYVNLSDPVASGTGTFTASGFITVFWVDLDLAA